jgi:hypothetical protein
MLVGCLSGTRLGCCVLSRSREATTPDIPYFRDPKDELEREARETGESPRTRGRSQIGNRHDGGYARELNELRGHATADGNTEHS